MKRDTTALMEIDELLRGRKTGADALAKGTGHLDAGLFVKAAIALGACYGLFMGLFAVFTRGVPGMEQMAATMLKVPLVFILTLAVTYPSLYVFSAMLGAKHGPASLLRILIAAIVVNLAVLASFGPITGFFTLTTTSYPFMKLLNIAFFALAGCIGLEFLRKALFRLEFDSDVPPAPAAMGAPPRPDPDAPVRRMFNVWVVACAFVGAQMCWVLRPLIGDPKSPFVWYAGPGGNAVADAFQAVRGLFGG